MNMTLRELLNILIGFTDRELMFKDVPRMIGRGQVVEHFNKFDPSSPVSHVSINIGDNDTALNRIKCPIYHDNEKSDILFNNYLCSCGLLFVFPAETQLEKHTELKQFRGMGVCPCTTCIHWNSLVRKCTYGD